MRTIKTLVAMTLVLVLAMGFAAAEGKELPELPEGVVPVTWDVDSEHLMIQTDEAMAFYKQIKAGEYPTMEELKAHPVVAQLDALSAYYKALYGNTLEIDTPERDAMRQEKIKWFLSLGSARTESIDENGKHHYVYDGELKKEYQFELVLGLPASGKSGQRSDGRLYPGSGYDQGAAAGIYRESWRRRGLDPLRGHHDL